MLTRLIETARCRLALAALTLSSALAPGVLVPALAQADYGSWIACSTQSNGYTFRNADYGSDASRRRVIEDCQRSSYTSNGQCRYNVTCDGIGQTPYARCTAESNGYRFVDGGPDPYQTMASVIEQCVKSSYTSNGQCRYTAACDAIDPASIVRCETRSNGYAFRDADFDGRAAMDRTLRACEQSSYTNNGQCRASLSCSGGIHQPGPIFVPAPPVARPPVVVGPPVSPVPGTAVATCSTSAAGRSFRVTGVTFRDTRARVIAECERFVGPLERPACQRNSVCQ